MISPLKSLEVQNFWLGFWWKNPQKSDGASPTDSRFPEAPPPGSYRPSTHLCEPRVKTPAGILEGGSAHRRWWLVDKWLMMMVGWLIIGWWWWLDDVDFWSWFPGVPAKQRAGEASGHVFDVACCLVEVFRFAPKTGGWFQIDSCSNPTNPTGEDDPWWLSWVSNGFQLLETVSSTIFSICFHFFSRTFPILFHLFSHIFPIPSVVGMIINHFPASSGAQFRTWDQVFHLGDGSGSRKQKVLEREVPSAGRQNLGDPEASPTWVFPTPSRCASEMVFLVPL